MKIKDYSASKTIYCLRQPDTNLRHDGLLLTLGNLCVEQQLWGKAQSYMEAALAVEPGRAAHLALARLFDQLGRSESANRHYRAAAEF